VFRFGPTLAWRFGNNVKVMRASNRCYEPDMDIYLLDFFTHFSGPLSSGKIYLLLSFSFKNFIQYINSAVHTKRKNK